MIKNVTFINPERGYQNLKEELDAKYFSVMERAALIDKSDLKEFEMNFAEYCGVKYTIGVNSGYHALEIALRALGIGNGDEVIVPSHTFVASCSAIVNAGATPVLVDVGTDFNIDVDKIERFISPKTKAVMPVHLSGYMADMPRIMELADKYNLKVVEDAAQSVGSSINGKRAGAWGEAGCFSFYPFKILGGYGDGGAITTNDPILADFAIKYRFNGEDRETREYHSHGVTALLDNLQAAFLDVKLQHLPEWIERRKSIAERYRLGLEMIPDLTLPHYYREGFDHVYQNYTLLSRQGDDFSNYLKMNGVGVITQWRKPYYKHEGLGLVNTGFPITEKLSSQVCSLPMNAELNDDEVDYVVKVVRSFYNLESL